MTRKQLLEGAVGYVIWGAIVALVLWAGVHFGWDFSGACNWDGCGPQ